MFKKLIRSFKFIWFYPLNVTNCLVSLWRVISFQTSIRIIKALIILPFVNGAKLTLSRGMIGGTSDWYCRLREYDSLKHQLKLLQAKYKFISNSLYLKKLNEIKRRIFRKNIYTLRMGQKI